jgi:hypothetical protein
MFTRKVQFYLLLTLLALSMFTVPALANSNVAVQLTGAGGAEYGLGQNIADGEYVMPYYLTINQSSPIAVTCDDFLHTVSIGDQWTATVSTFADLSGTRFWNPLDQAGSITMYHEAAWLASQINASSSLPDIAGVQFAIWRLFTPGAPQHVGNEDYWYNLALNEPSQNYGGMNFSNVEVLTPNNPLSPQEYFFFIPEPSVYLDLAFGLLAFVAIRRVQRGRVGAALNQS